MENKYIRVAWGIGGILIAVILAGAAGGCDLAPADTPTPAPTATARIVVYTATPQPSPPATPSPTMTTPAPTSLPSPTQTRPPAPTPTIAGSPVVSPSPTTPPYQLTVRVSDPKPIRGSYVIVYAQLTHQGQGVARAQVYVMCRYRATNVRYPVSGFAETNPDGLATVGFDTTLASRGETVLVDVYARYQGQEFQAQTSFQPR